MDSFHGKLLDGERVVFSRVSGVYEGKDARGRRCGQLEVHEGSTPMLRTSRAYRLSLDDGRSEDIMITGLRQSGTAGITLLAFQSPEALPVRNH